MRGWLRERNSIQKDLTRKNEESSRGQTELASEKRPRGIFPLVDRHI